ncbi:MAG: DUF456 domain-containing protein [Candidatus Paceibacterota bacterium]|jgi:hypothetical protein
MSQDIIIKIIFSLLLVPGVFMVVIPIMPAISYMLLITLIFGIIDHFQTLTAGNFLILIAIWTLSILIDHLSGILGAKYGGASRKGMICGFIGLIVGFLMFPPFGGFLGLFAGVLTAEILNNRSQKEALTAAGASLFGSILGVAVNTILAVIFLILFVAFMMW